MKKIIFTSVLLLAINFAFSQEEEKQTNWELNGYISNMQSATFDSIGANWINDNIIHNRLNFKWYPIQELTFSLDLRSRIFTGESLKYTPGYDEIIRKNNGLIDLSVNLINEKSILMNSYVDRIFLSFEKGNLQATIGRQRINWGRSFAWNPNDIFNTYSFFDFDYEEKPGTDAFRILYYSGMTSSFDIAVSANKDKKITAGALYKFNLHDYDFQFLSGIINEQDYTVGFGWEGGLKSIGFRGELSYLIPKENMADTSGLLITSVSFDYSFANSVGISFEFLYNQQMETGGISSFADYYSNSLSIKKLSFTEYNFFARISYPLTPLLNVTFSAMFYPEVKGYFIGPSLEYSFKDNLYFSVFAQHFSAILLNKKTNNEERTNLNLFFLRLKYNF